MLILFLDIIVHFDITKRYCKEFVVNKENKKKSSQTNPTKSFKEERIKVFLFKLRLLICYRVSQNKTFQWKYFNFLICLFVQVQSILYILLLTFILNWSLRKKGLFPLLFPSLYTLPIFMALAGFSTVNYQVELIYLFYLFLLQNRSYHLKKI